ncbi:hypothetical protein MML48_1g05652 [Holotrichia oblita]|uniref:Uncharacterized protein n=1 Tax=Holotrichia oblita TaxID=644536 RepID=A0ACB9TZF2_HOLOL|nr:hypothetical protein MML48_1g05652 [Holotrichia oblita]
MALDCQTDDVSVGGDGGGGRMRAVYLMTAGKFPEFRLEFPAISRRNVRFRVTVSRVAVVDFLRGASYRETEVFFAEKKDDINESADGRFKTNDTETSMQDRVECLRRLYAEVKQRLEKAAEKNRKYYDLRRRNVTYEIGDQVYRKNYVHSDAANFYSAKLAPKYIGPIVISRKVSPWMYVLENLDGKTLGTWHVKDLKPCSE